MAFDLKKLLKTLLISTSEPLTARDVQSLVTRFHQENAPELEEITEEDNDNKPENPSESTTDTTEEAENPAMTEVPSLLTKTQIEEAMDQIRDELTASDDVYILKQGPHGYYLATTPEYAEWVRLLRKEPKPLKLRQAALETLAIIAYRQPVTRAEIEAIRGVSVDSAVAKLVELEFIHVTGRAELPGRPMQYGTTDQFLDFCGIAHLEELPASDVIESGQLSKWLQEQTEGVTLSDADMGLHEEHESSETTSESEIIIEKAVIIDRENETEEELEFNDEALPASTEDIM